MAFVKEFISEEDKVKYKLNRDRAYTIQDTWVIDRERDAFLRFIDKDDRWGVDSTGYYYWLFYYQGVYLHLGTFPLDVKDISQNLKLITEKVYEIAIYHDTSSPLKINLNKLPVDKYILSDFLKEAFAINENYSSINPEKKANHVDFVYEVTFHGE